jgi:hypothetical protein
MARRIATDEAVVVTAQRRSGEESRRGIPAQCVAKAAINIVAVLRPDTSRYVVPWNLPTNGDEAIQRARGMVADVLWP